MNDLFMLAVAVVTSVTTFLGIVPEKVTHDGTKTGERVGYQSYCYPEQGFVIYENEKIPFITDEGKSVLWTRDDVDCYKKNQIAIKKDTGSKTTATTATSKTKIPQPVSNNSDPVVTCNNPNCGPISIPKSQCSDVVGYVCCQLGNKWSWYASRDQCTKDQTAKQNPSDNKRLVTITCTTIYGTYTSYGNTHEEASAYCSKLQQEALKGGEQNKALLDDIKQGYNGIMNQTFPPSTQTSQSYAEANQKCKSDVLGWYNSQVQNANAMYGGGSSTGPAMIQIAKQEYETKISNCDKSYPVN